MVRHSGGRRDGYRRRDCAISVNRRTQAVLLVCYLGVKETAGNTHTGFYSIGQGKWNFACLFDSEGQTK